MKRTRIATFACFAALLLLPIAITSGSASGAAGQGIGQAQASAARGASRCKNYPSVVVCVKVLERLRPHFAIGYRDSIRNSTGHSIAGHCHANSQTTVHYGVSASISAEAKAFVFASVSATVTTDISKEISSGINVGTDFRVPAHTTTYCDRGVMVERYRVRRCIGNESGADCTRFRFRAPSRNVWHVWNRHN